MDEVDGMSAGDRGGVGALNALIKKSKVSNQFDWTCTFHPDFSTWQIPIICIANDRGAQKLRPLMSTAYSLNFQKYERLVVSSKLMFMAL